MALISPQYSPEEVDEAGRTLVWAEGAESGISESERLHAVDVVSQWRASHNRPLNTFRANLRRRAGRRGVVAQRLKRLPSIVSKLVRIPRIRLSQMQDIGGCRAIVPTAADAANLAADLISSRIRHKLVRYHNYISKPRGTGYRGLHLMYEYDSDMATEWQGLQIEIQLRSRLQHQWATAVETVGTFIGDELKSNRGDQGWLRFFALMSSAIALSERTPLVPDTPTNQPEIVEEIRRCNEELEVSDRLSAFQRVTTRVRELRGKRVVLTLLELNLETGSMTGLGYRANELEEAISKYRAMEEESRGNPRVDVVLVSTDSLSALRRAYPNYFADISRFSRMVNEFIAQE